MYSDSQGSLENETYWQFKHLCKPTLNTRNFHCIIIDIMFEHNIVRKKNLLSRVGSLLVLSVLEIISISVGISVSGVAGLSSRMMMSFSLACSV